MTKRASRSRFLLSIPAVSSIAVIQGRASGAQWSYKLGHPNPVDFPQHVWTVQMCQAIKRETNGRLEITVYPNATLGSQSALVQQVRLGAAQFIEVGNSTFGTLIPVSSVTSVGFAFPDSKTSWAAHDGPLGAYIRKEYAAKGMYVFEKVWDYGIRQMTSSTHPIRNANDFVGFKLRVQPTPLIVDMFKTLGASPVPLDATELYTGLQTHLIDGQENSYAIIESYRIYEVQKYLSVTNSSWAGSWLVANAEAWNALPPDIQAVVERNAAKYALLERRDSNALNNSLADKIRRQGLIFNTADVASIRAKLGPHYTRWKAEFGPNVWGMLEQYSGKLG